MFAVIHLAVEQCVGAHPQATRMLPQLFRVSVDEVSSVTRVKTYTSPVDGVIVNLRALPCHVSCANLKQRKTSLVLPWFLLGRARI
eukprot:3450995-Amphidinium_carterae.1